MRDKLKPFDKKNGGFPLFYFVFKIILITLIYSAPIWLPTVVAVPDAIDAHVF